MYNTVIRYLHTSKMITMITLCVLLLQLCPTLCGPMDCSPQGSSVHGIFQARILEWVAISFSKGSSQPRDLTHVSYISCIGRSVLYQQSYLTIQSYCSVIGCIPYAIQPILVTFILYLDICMSTSLTY